MWALLTSLLLTTGATQAPQAVQGEGGPPLEPTTITVTGDRVDYMVPPTTLRALLEQPGSQYLLISSVVKATDGSGECWEVRVEIAEADLPRDIGPAASIDSFGVVDTPLLLSRAGVRSVNTTTPTTFTATTTINPSQTLGGCPAGQACFDVVRVVCSETVVVAAEEPPAVVASLPPPAAPPPPPQTLGAGIIVKTNNCDSCCTPLYARTNGHEVQLVSDGNRFRPVIVVDHSGYKPVSCDTFVPVVYHHGHGFGHGHAIHGCGW